MQVLKYIYINVAFECFLADCLACSGCITSAESILIEQQSSVELRKTFLSKIANEGKIKKIIVSLQIQPIVSIAQKFNLSVDATVLKLVKYFKNLGADFVYDLKVAEDMALIEHQRELFEGLFFALNIIETIHRYILLTNLFFSY